MAEPIRDARRELLLAEGRRVAAQLSDVIERQGLDGEFRALLARAHDAIGSPYSDERRRGYRTTPPGV